MSRMRPKAAKQTCLPTCLRIHSVDQHQLSSTKITKLMLNKKPRLLNARTEEFQPVTLVELKRQVGKLGKSWAPGLSKIRNLMLRALPDSFLSLFVQLINTSLRRSTLPTAGKMAKVKSNDVLAN